MVAHRKLYISHHRRRDSILGAGAGALRGAGGRSGGRSRTSFISFSVSLLISHFRFSFVQRSCSRSVCNIEQFISGFAFPFGFMFMLMFMFRFGFGFGFRFGSGFGCRSSQQALRRSSQGWDSGLLSVFCVSSAALEYPFLRSYCVSCVVVIVVVAICHSLCACASPASASSASPASPSPSTSTFPSAPPVSPTPTESKTASVTSPHKTCPREPLISTMPSRLKHETKRHGKDLRAPKSAQGAAR